MAFIVKACLSLMATQAFYLLVNDKNVPCPSWTILEVYHHNKDEDGFLYMTYTSQEMFGRGGGCRSQ
uniref:Autophagy-related protein n=1 Tax=Varanus komodoensis TaxID=61221 RepID=A0A8D2IFL3_VARKO